MIATSCKNHVINMSVPLESNYDRVMRTIKGRGKLKENDVVVGDDATGKFCQEIY